MHDETHGRQRNGPIQPVKMTEKLKLFYTRQARDMVECCIVFEGEFYSKPITPEQAIDMARDLLDQAQAAKRENENG